MTDWFKAGFFNSSLQVRQEGDSSFTELGELIKKYGPSPFTSPVIPTVNPADKMALLLQQQLLQKQMLASQAPTPASSILPIPTPAPSVLPMLRPQIEANQVLGSLSKMEGWGNLSEQQKQTVSFLSCKYFVNFQIRNLITNG